MERDWQESVARLLGEAGLGGCSVARMEPLSGGVSSDIVLIILDDGRRFCAKRALPVLKVDSEWRAPVERSHSEAEWLREAAAIVPGAAPRLLAEDRSGNAILMEYLPPEEFLPWKGELLAGQYEADAPARVAVALARIHSATWGDPEIAATFATDAMFDALRLDPYLRAVGRRHPDLSTPILAVLATTASTRRALVHGDVSPKNILIHRGDHRPVFLDAECAWYGDPAFDAAFCVNHLMLKSLHLEALRERLLEGAEAFLETWVAGIPMGERGPARERVLALLPCLLIARVDGKSPVEYLSPANRGLVRALAPPFIRRPPASLGHLAAALRDAADRRSEAPA